MIEKHTLFFYKSFVKKPKKYSKNKTFKYLMLLNNASKGGLMAEEEKKFSKQLVGKTVVSKTGKKFGEVGDIIFETSSGELIHLVLSNPTTYTEKLELEKTKENEILIPFSAVMAIGDFLVVAEEDIV
jgi:sporulation protein YlmC with PRC-barrel domain|tara:strand:- start:1480 stop:1863 length:384 start_codon:yes stop_codon:yes gene_type:complete